LCRLRHAARCDLLRCCFQRFQGVGGAPFRVNDEFK
jgi:hypothetical protein